MAQEMTDALALKLLDLSTGVATAAPITGPLKLALLTAQGSDTAAGTEVTGGSYARQTITFGAASLVSAVPTVSNSNAITFSGMPTATVVGFAIYDSAGTPLREWDAPFASSRGYQAGDAATVAIAAIVLTLD